MGIHLVELLNQKKDAILKTWYTQTIETYPSETARFLKAQKDPFANPVGQTIKKGTAEILDVLLSGADITVCAKILDPIIRIRAVQNFTPAQAVSFLILLKQIIRNVIPQEIKSGLVQELLDFETRLDEVCLVGFNVYMACRENVFELKTNELRLRTLKVFERAGLVKETPEETPDETNSKSVQ